MARVLFITQKIDLDDDVLGVYHRWVERLSEKVEKINVVCLYKGRNELPKKVSVYSLGKEVKPSKIMYIVNFYKYIWKLRHDYDVVLVHMNPVYVVLGGLFWKLWGKKVLLWHNHPVGNLMAKTGIFFSNNVFCTSPYSFSAQYKKTIIMPVGVDTDLFKPMPQAPPQRNRILFLGRISPIKKIEVLIGAVRLLDADSIDFELVIVGSAFSSKDKQYELELKKMAAELLSKGKIVFKSAVPNYKTPEIYNSSGIFVNLTPTGSFDKTTLEAMACGTIVLVSNRVFLEFFDDEVKKLCMFEELSRSDLASKILRIGSSSPDYKDFIRSKLRPIVVNQHGLENLIKNLVSVFNRI